MALLRGRTAPAPTAVRRRDRDEESTLTTDALIHLDRLRCIKERDGNGHSEPYVWPLLIWVDDDTISSGDFVRGLAHGNTFSREVVKSGMRAGETAPIPASVRTLARRFDDDDSVRQVGIVVLLMEWDETPMTAVRAAYSAYVRELPRAIGDFVRVNLRAPEGEAEIQAIADVVRPKITEAGKGALSSFEKVRVFLGTLNLDDEQGFAQFFLDLGARALPDPQFTLRLVTTREREVGGVEVVETVTEYEIDGHYELRQPPPPDPCQAQVDRLRRARAALAGLEGSIRLLQEELGSAAPGVKAGIVAQIRRIQEQDLPVAEAEVTAARRALDRCRALQAVRGPSVLVEEQGRVTPV